MALLDLFYETISKQLAFGLNGPIGLKLPVLRQEESLVMSLTIIKRVSYTAPPLFERMNMTGWSLQVSVGIVASVLASQNTWDEDDINQGRFVGNVNLNTAGINALADGATVWIEIRLFDGTNYTGARFRTTVSKAIAVAGSPQAPPGDTGLGALQADRLYVRREGRPGEVKVWQSANGTKRIQYLHDDGSLRLEPIT